MAKTLIILYEKKEVVLDEKKYCLLCFGAVFKYDNFLL